MKKETNNRERAKPVGMEGLAWDANKPMSLTFDYELYAHYLDDPNLSDEQKREFFETLSVLVIVKWCAIATFTDEIVAKLHNVPMSSLRIIPKA